jgi:ATP-binding protein involved in chromosome partitioning
MITKDKVLETLKGVKDPELNKSLVELNMIRNIRVEDTLVSLDVILTIQGCPLKLKIQQDIEEAIQQLGAKQVKITFGSMTEVERAALSAQLRKEQQVKSGQGIDSSLLAPDSKTKFISITSGKGGVGKSTVTVNLSLALAQEGNKVGIIDADIYGFSIPDMMGIDQRPVVIGEMILPVERYGVKVMSMGFFVEDNAPVVWRGPMLGKMLRNFLSEVYWGNDLDYLLFDMPPGTGDVALDIYQMIPNCKQIIVTTPHATASFVAARAGAMALHKTKQQILGVIENMSWYEHPNGVKDYVFGKNGGEVLAKELKVELLAQIPLDSCGNEKDSFLCVYDQNKPIGKIYQNLARNIMTRSLVKH